MWIVWAFVALVGFCLALSMVDQPPAAIRNERSRKSLLVAEVDSPICVRGRVRRNYDEH